MCPIVHLTESLGGGTGTGSSSAACVSHKGKGEQCTLALRQPSARLGEATCTSLSAGLLDMDKTLMQGAQVKEIADVSAAAAQVSVRSSQL